MRAIFRTHSPNRESVREIFIPSTSPFVIQSEAKNLGTYSTERCFASALLVVLALSGLGFALFSSPNVNAIMSAVKSAHYGVASSVVSTARMLGQSLSMTMILLVFALTTQGKPLLPEHGVTLFHSMRIAFGVSTVLSLLGVLASLARGRMHSSQ